MSLKNSLIVVAREKPAKIVNKKQQVQFIQSNFVTTKPKVKVKVKSAYGPMWPTRPELIPVSVA